MKKIFAVFLAICIIPSFNTYAWVGGPFSNNSLTPEGDDGIYEAIAIPTTGNGIGMYRWGVFNRNPGGTAFNTNTFRNAGNTSNVQFGGFSGAFNQHTWFFNGITYFGPCFGTVNSGAGGIVTCVGNASTADSRVEDEGTVGGPLISTTSPNTQLVFNLVTGEPILIALGGDFANSFFMGRLQKDNSSRSNGFDSVNAQVAVRNFSGTGEIRLGLFNPTQTPDGGFVEVPNDPADPSAGSTQRPTFGSAVIDFQVFGSRVSLQVTG